mmetsp:Transcript_33524/g.66233  ORF Transcript_33524/g.66233 Transcript_33524/m.66233 type:complete len:450 (-) Transcript_33524:291-1640(-)|eukprot:CAMPEP_0194326346 /NCGR_PEP_ID=MMETSP0171-20130528/36167_1 /TAXON_ID=218684 /ORGANISM="Corethron pennatum, Strain L29A3" /LENGTH=449 /DNA_ID=CAMNT_0039085895 /DNA_START=15 /DNA_END=1364 /DNA_ORIENTATION=-
MIRSLLFSTLTLLFISALQPSIQRRGAVGIVTAFAFKHEVRAGRSINKGVTAVRELSSTATDGATATTDSASIHVPVGKDGDGAYTAATKGCFDVIDEATPLVLQEVRKQPIDTGRPFHVADYGTADGGTSLGLLTKIVRAVRERTGTESDKEEQHEIVIHYEDQLMNEWKSVFNHALGYKQVTDAYGRDVSVPTDEGDVYVEASGVGFHSQCYPSSSIDLGVSFTAMHWLSTSPSSLKGTTEVMHAARCSTGPPAAEHLQAGKDWSSILGARSKELVKGGRFVCVNFCVSGEGYFLGQTDRGASMWDSFLASWNKLHADGLIDERERLGVSFPNYYRTTAEFMDGIQKHPHLKLISAEERIVRCPYREQYVNGGNDNMSPQEYAKSFVPTTKTWSHSTFKAALGNERSDEEKEQILEKFWKNYEDLVARNPEDHGMDYVHSYLVIEKV